MHVKNAVGGIIFSSSSNLLEASFKFLLIKAYWMLNLWNHDADLVFSTTELVLYFGVQLECYAAWRMSVNTVVAKCITKFNNGYYLNTG